MICTTLNAIREHSPCADGWAQLLAHLGKTGPDDEPLPLVVILDSNGIDDALWALRTIKGEDARIRHFAVWCARQVQHLITDARSLAALDVTERYAAGLATDGELRDAEAAAWAAATDAALAAAGVAAWDAARAAAWSAARAAALDAGWDTAQNPVEGAMRERQAEKFREVFGEQEVERE